jgi:hypothetical protein
MANVKSFEEFTKKGESALVKKHYSGEEKGEAGYATIETQKDAIEKGGKVDHTEKLNAKDLSNPKPPTK